MGEKAVHSIRCTELEDRDCGDSQFPAIPELVQDFLFHLDLYKFKGPDGIHHKVPREMANFTARPLCYFSMVLGIWRRTSCLEAG